MSDKRYDSKNRWRNKSIAFRGSPEEAAELDKRWRFCGYSSKQDYLLDSVLHQQVIAKGNPMMFVAFRDELKEILNQLLRIQNASEMDEELLTPIRTMLEILEAFKENEEKAEQKEGNMTEDELKQAENEIQKLTDKSVEEIDKIFENKEKEVMSV